MNYNIQSILYASDMTARSHIVFLHAAGLAQKFQAQLHILTVFRPGIDISKLDDSEEAKHDQSEDILRERIDAFDQVHPELEVKKYIASVHGVEGDPAKVILQTAKEISADLIVMGSRGHSALDEILLGSVSHKVNLKTTIPIMLVPFDRD